MKALLPLVAMCFASAVELPAQERGIPRDFVLAILSHRLEADPANEPRILVGEIPKNLTHVPKLDFPVLGSAVYDEMVLIVYRVTGNLTAAQQSARAQLQAAGWRTQTGEPPRDESGFISTEGDLFEIMHLCRDNAMAMIETAAVRKDLRVLKLNIVHEACDQGWTSYSDVSFSSGGLVALGGMDKIPMPKLEPPAGAQVVGGGMMPGFGRFNSSATVTTQLSSAKLIDHYASQLQTQGWSTLGATDGEVTKVRNWRITHEGNQWLAALIATQLSEGRYVVEISLYPLSDR